MIASAQRGELQIVFPTVKHLERVAQFADVAALLHPSPTEKTTIPVELPETRAGEDGLVIRLPPTVENTW